MIANNSPETSTTAFRYEYRKFLENLSEGLKYDSDRSDVRSKWVESDYGTAYQRVLNALWSLQ
ncbi:MAG: hypothetical protein EOP06_27175 [Proteobacteria bacterium]|nr:MAG: hypothetical protein EOP06_27175 [Pseudomonadota bacterium]